MTEKPNEVIESLDLDEINAMLEGERAPKGFAKSVIVDFADSGEVYQVVTNLTPYRRVGPQSVNNSLTQNLNKLRETDSKYHNIVCKLNKDKGFVALINVEAAQAQDDA